MRTKISLKEDILFVSHILFSLYNDGTEQIWVTIRLKWTAIYLLIAYFTSKLLYFKVKHSWFFKVYSRYIIWPRDNMTITTKCVLYPKLETRFPWELQNNISPQPFFKIAWKAWRVELINKSKTEREMMFDKHLWVWLSGVHKLLTTKTFMAIVNNGNPEHHQWN